jgi:hypothetical protein
MYELLRIMPAVSAVVKLGNLKSIMLLKDLESTNKLDDRHVELSFFKQNLSCALTEHGVKINNYLQMLNRNDLHGNA